jgi:membrane-associated protease RseP (regulator of RpoE activity)
MNPDHELRPVPALEPAAEPLPPVRRNLILFALTVVSVFYAGASYAVPDDPRSFVEQILDPRFMAQGAAFALPLLAILVTHEFGHFFAARFHRVPASFPYFIPFPLPPFGTMGAVIAMRGAIRSRNALLDIGASGPLAGLLVAIPALMWGLSQSAVNPNGISGYTQEGQSLLYWLLKRVVVGPIPDGHDVWLHPTAFAGWAGLFLTMINLMPWGQLDGGHIAYALIGERHHRIAHWFHRGLLLLCALNLVHFVLPVLLGRSDLPLALAIGNSQFWLVWFFVLLVIGRLSGGPRHPPCEPGELSSLRRGVGWFSLAVFLLLFMPTPLASY